MHAHRSIVHAVDVELLLDDVPELGVCDGERLPLAVLLDELAEALRQLALDQSGGGAQGCSRVVKLVESLELHHLEEEAKLLRIWIRNHCRSLLVEILLNIGGPGRQKEQL